MQVQRQAVLPETFDSPQTDTSRRSHCSRRFSADSLPLFGTMSNVTLAPSASELKPAFSTAEMCTKISLPPLSGCIKPALGRVEPLHSTRRHVRTPFLNDDDNLVARFNLVERTCFL